MAKIVSQRFPDTILAGIDGWAAEAGIGRTAAITLMCKTFLEMYEVGELRRENRKLRERLAAMEMAGGYPGGKWGN